jgi:hypothetical protein
MVNRAGKASPRRHRFVAATAAWLNYGMRV